MQSHENNLTVFQMCKPQKRMSSMQSHIQNSTLHQTCTPQKGMNSMQSHNRTPWVSRILRLM